VKAQRKALLKLAAGPTPTGIVHLRMEYVRDPQEPELPLMQLERTPAGASPAAEPKATREIIKNWLPKVESRMSVPRPLGYVVPAAQEDVIKTLLDHGIKLQRVARETTVEVQVYKIGEVVPSKEDYVAPEKIEVSLAESRMRLQKGDFYVSGAQPAANLIPCLLEPQSEFGLIRYQAYKLIPPKGSFFPILRISRAQKLPLETRP
jgi:hypothetical protein